MGLFPYALIRRSYEGTLLYFLTLESSNRMATIECRFTPAHDDLQNVKAFFTKYRYNSSKEWIT